MALSSEQQNQNGRECVISVVIPCYNARNTIRFTLDAILGQRTRYPYEVIVVDSSNDGTEEIIAADYPDVRLIRMQQKTLPGSGRNIGIENARGVYVAFTDADCVPDPDWLECIVTQFHQVKTDAVGGCLINGYPKNLTAWVSHLIEFNEWTETTPEGYVTNIPSANLAYRRNAFFEFGVQFTDIFPSEDTILNWTMHQKGAKIYFNPKIRVVHLNRVGFRKLFQHQYHLGMASACARRTTSLPGKIFVQYPFLAIGLPLIRWVRLFGRLVQKDLKKLGIFLALTPIYLAATVAWSAGFTRKGRFSHKAYSIRGIALQEVAIKNFQDVKF